MIFRHCLVTVGIVLPTVAFGITWVDTTVIDPISGTPCEVREPASWGSYIYDWESKYDGVYWPFIDMNWVWHCPASGYTSFGSDFLRLTATEWAAVGQLPRMAHCIG